MRGAPASSDADGEPAVREAKAAFRTAAAQQLKCLMAEGIEGGQASTHLMDELTRHRAQQSGGASWSSSRVQEVVTSTGYSPDLATRTLFLKDEISQLRRQGHTTATVIEQLQRRLQSAGRRRKAAAHENAGQPSSYRASHHHPGKRQKPASDDCLVSAAVATSPRGEKYDQPPALSIAESFRVPQGRVGGHEKRHRDEMAHVGQLKKLKLRASLSDTT